MKKILIVEDEFDYLECLFNDLNDSIPDNVKIAKICTDGESALNYIQNTEVDIVLLDLVIPKINGLEILEKIKKESINTKVIVISGESNSILEIIKRNINVSKILHKPFKMKELIDSINQILIDISQTDVESKIEKILSEFNFNKTNIGYKYILDCLYFCIEKNYKSINHTKDLYRDIAKNYRGVTPKNISWNISKCIQVMNKLTLPTTMKKYFPYNSTPSQMNFINEILSVYYTL